MFIKDQHSYQRLRLLVSERTNRIVLWCGAGLSMDAGMPSWSKLRSNLQGELLEKAVAYERPDQEQTLKKAEAIERQKNPWVAFQQLRKEVGFASFRGCVREALNFPPGRQIPDIYRRIWQLRPSGVINLNLDRIATQAHGIVDTKQQLAEFNSRSVGQYGHVLKSPNPFIYNAHGVIEDVDSWVFTQRELDELMKNDGYQAFIKSVLMAYTVVFVGISADDVAVGGHLDKLRENRIDVGAHYWITHRADQITNSWAESAGIETVYYRTVNGSHHELIELFDDLLGFTPPEDAAFNPVSLEAPLPEKALLSPDELKAQPAEEVRQILNRHVKEILREVTPESIREYESFCEEYEEAIHQAWFISTRTGRNKLLGYALEERVAEGSFGNVYRALGPEGDVVAVKVLREEIRSKQMFLQSFRRGVRAMDILAKRNVDGIVKYRDQSEIPAFVAMEWIDGLNLSQALEADYIQDWNDILWISVELSSIVRTAHLLPDRVLHRDLRPANIMIEQMWNVDERRLVVLDFDLSWYQGAYMMSIEAVMTGYHAPEQIQSIPGVSTRNAAVDSFGLGMTLYFLISNQEPSQNQQLHQDWEQGVHKYALKRPCYSWVSLPQRFARLIVNSTRDRQAERWDMGQISVELQRLNKALISPNDVEDAELIAEEIAARSMTLRNYEWDADYYTARVGTPSGITIEVHANETKRQIELKINSLTREYRDRKTIAQVNADIVNQASRWLNNQGWVIERNSGNRTGIDLLAMIPVSLARSSVGDVAELIDRLVERFSFH